MDYPEIMIRALKCSSASPCHPESNEGSEAQPNQAMIALSTVEGAQLDPSTSLGSAQDDNSAVFYMILLAILRRSMSLSRIHLFRMMSVVGGKAIISV